MKTKEQVLEWIESLIEAAKRFDEIEELTIKTDKGDKKSWPTKFRKAFILHNLKDVCDLYGIPYTVKPLGEGYHYNFHIEVEYDYRGVTWLLEDYFDEKVDKNAGKNE